MFDVSNMKFTSTVSSKSCFEYDVFDKEVSCLIAFEVFSTDLSSSFEISFVALMTKRRFYVQEIKGQCSLFVQLVLDLTRTPSIFVFFHFNQLIFVIVLFCFVYK